MTNNDSLFVGSIPEIYDTYLVPMMFQGYADDIADRVAALAPKDVLEIATGTGVITRTLAPKLVAEAHYTVTDLNQPMIDHAASKQGADGRITWQQADALALPFEDASFDAIVCGFAAMFFPDKIAGYSEALRVLRPGGTFIFNVWDRVEENESSVAVGDAVAEIFPHDPPLFLVRTPYGYHDVQVIEEDLRKSGFSQISITTLNQTLHAASARDIAIAYCQGTPLRNDIAARGAELVGPTTDKVEQAMIARYGTGAITGGLSAHVMTVSR
jgi:ubiquinone/menaquinone biosynthesis C-methylase UbiE